LLFEKPDDHSLKLGKGRPRLMFQFLRERRKAPSRPLGLLAKQDVVVHPKPALLYRASIGFSGPQKSMIS